MHFPSNFYSICKARREKRCEIREFTNVSHRRVSSLPSHSLSSCVEKIHASFLHFISILKVVCFLERLVEISVCQLKWKVYWISLNERDMWKSTQNSHLLCVMLKDIFKQTFFSDANSWRKLIMFSSFTFLHTTIYFFRNFICLHFYFSPRVYTNSRLFNLLGDFFSSNLFSNGLAFIYV